MIGMSFMQLLSRCMTFTVIIEMGMNVFALFTLVELGIYLLYKIIRRNFRYHLNFTHNGFSLFMSLLIRIMVKIVSDFTGMVYFRHPYELGGIYWFLSNVYSFGALFLSLSLLRGDEVAKKSLSENFLFSDGWELTIALSLTAMWVSLFALMLLLCQKGYSKTFFSFKSARKYTKEIFDTGGDESKLSVLHNHPSYYSHFFDEMKNYLDKNWERLFIDRPHYFNEYLINQIPDNLIPGGRSALEESFDTNDLAKTKRIEGSLTSPNMSSWKVSLRSSENRSGQLSATHQATNQKLSVSVLTLVTSMVPGGFNSKINGGASNFIDPGLPNRGAHGSQRKQSLWSWRSDRDNRNSRSGRSLGSYHEVPVRGNREASVMMSKRRSSIAPSEDDVFERYAGGINNNERSAIPRGGKGRIGGHRGSARRSSITAVGGGGRRSSTQLQGQIQSQLLNQLGVDKSEPNEPLQKGSPRGGNTTSLRRRSAVIQERSASEKRRRSSAVLFGGQVPDLQNYGRSRAALADDCDDF